MTAVALALALIPFWGGLINSFEQETTVAHVPSLQA